MTGACACHFVVEADGSVYPCDFYVDDRHRLGSLEVTGLREMFRQRDRARVRRGIAPAGAKVRLLPVVPALPRRMQALSRRRRDAGPRPERAVPRVRGVLRRVRRTGGANGALPLRRDAARARLKRGGLRKTTEALCANEDRRTGDMKLLTRAILDDYAIERCAPDRLCAVQFGDDATLVGLIDRLIDDANRAGAKRRRGGGAGGRVGLREGRFRRRTACSRRTSAASAAISRCAASRWCSRSCARSTPRPTTAR